MPCVTRSRPTGAPDVTALLDVEDLRLEIATDHGRLYPVQGVSLTLAAGETLAIVGESGCGKSLSTMAITGLVPPRTRLSARRILFKDQSLLGLREREWRRIRGRRIAVIFQDPMTSLDPCYTIEDQMREIGRQHLRLSTAELRARALDLLRRVGISSPETRLSQYPHQLSGGLRQRVMIAIALLCEPELIIADEPTTALDVTIQAQVLRLLADLQRERGFGLILITHDLGVVAGTADRIAVMYGGQIVESGPTDAVLAQPAHPYTEGLLRSIPVPGRTARGAPLGFIPGVVPRPDAPHATCSFINRCPRAVSACAMPIALMPVSPGQEARCIRPRIAGQIVESYDAAETAA
jgi:peptide/nickel transport system ATP-binding protein